jgi:hypothetical protein
MSRSGVSGHSTARQVDKTPAEPSGGGLTRVTVNLNRQAMQALEQIGSATGYSKTDVINRALQLYDLVQKIMERDDGALNVRHNDGEIERIHIL